MILQKSAKEKVMDECYFLIVVSLMWSNENHKNMSMYDFTISTRFRKSRNSSVVGFWSFSSSINGGLCLLSKHTLFSHSPISLYFFFFYFLSYLGFIILLFLEFIANFDIFKNFEKFILYLEKLVQHTIYKFLKIINLHVEKYLFVTFIIFFSILKHCCTCEVQLRAIHTRCN